LFEDTKEQKRGDFSRKERQVFAKFAKYTIRYFNTLRY